jgi:hypothetical protein
VTRLGIAALMLALLAVGGCRESADRGPSPLTPGPGASVNQQLDDIESTLDGIESELNDG